MVFLARQFPQLDLKEERALLAFKFALEENLRGRVHTLKLFGSKARGQSHPESDVDVLLVIRGLTPQDEELIFETVFEVLHQTGVLLSLHNFDEKEYLRLNQLPTVFMQLMNRDAISV